MSNKKMNVNVKPIGLLNLLAFKNLVPERKKRIENAPAEAIPVRAPVNVLAERLHPTRQYLVISDVRQETPDVRTYRLKPDTEKGTIEPAVFRPGQYLSFFSEPEGAYVTRPYSISSSPAEALQGFYEITVKRNEGGFISSYIWDNWDVGTKIVCSDPQGHFYYDNLRDSSNIVGIAGGSGVTPFRSMAKSILDGTLDIRLTLFYGCNRLCEAIFLEEFKTMEKNSDGKFRVIPVVCEEQVEQCELGYVTAEIIKKYVEPENCSFFICGPQAMYTFVEKELSSFDLRRKAVRREVFGEIKDIENTAGYPSEKGKTSYQVLVHINGRKETIPAASNESLLVAMERAGLCAPSRCRSGVCGVCRSLLINGDVFIPEHTDGRRMADKQFGYIHPCCSFPISDLEIVVPQER